MKHAILPHKQEWAVCHLGLAKVPMTDLFQTCWIIDEVCPSPDLAQEALDRRNRAASAQRHTEAADRRALERRRYREPN